MTKLLAAVAAFEPAAAVARFWRKNNGKRLSSECGRRQRSRPCPLMWLLAVSLAASSSLIYTTAAIHNPNKPQTTNYVRLTLSAYHGSKTEEKTLTTKAAISGGTAQTNQPLSYDVSMKSYAARIPDVRQGGDHTTYDAVTVSNPNVSRRLLVICDGPPGVMAASNTDKLCS
ncbi:hypothetical protein ABVT39_024811 [Epinephelus coioides]